MTDQTNEDTANTAPETSTKPVTAADKYADFITSKGGYKSIFQSDTVGMDNNAVAAGIGKGTVDSK